MLPAVKNIEILDPYMRMVKCLYLDAEVPVILGSILRDDVVLT